MAYRPKDCADCGNSFTPASGAQRKCSACGTPRTPIVRRCSDCGETFKPSRRTTSRCLSCIAENGSRAIQCPLSRCLGHYVPGDKHVCSKPSESQLAARLDRVNAAPVLTVLHGPPVSGRAVGVRNRETVNDAREWDLANGY